MYLYQQNIEKIKELLPDKQWAGEMWLNDCWNFNYKFRISEAARTQERQDRYFLVDRDTPEKMWSSYQNGKISLAHAKRGIELLKTVKPWAYANNPITWTLDSNHIKRLAVDVYPINCTHADIQSIAARYGISHPFKADPPHYEFQKAKLKPQTRQSTPREIRRKLVRLLKTATGAGYFRISQAIKNLK